MITEINLIKNRKYVKNHAKELCLGSEPKPLFVDGVFNIDNWNGGDDVVRQFISYIQEQKEWYQVFSKNNQTLIVRYVYDNDDNYVYIVHVNACGNSTKWFFKWYKNRGRIDKAICDDNVMTEIDYLYLLNKIKTITGFKFYFYDSFELKLC